MEYESRKMRFWEVRRQDKILLLEKIRYSQRRANH